MAWRPLQRVTLRASAETSIPYPKDLQITTALAQVEIDMAPEKSAWHVYAFTGVRHALIEYKDSQDLPNHVRAEIRACWTAGLWCLF